jgi:AraC-like DNA-binding protein
MLWRTNDTEVIVKKGDAFFVKKGALKVETFYKEDFCELIIFVPDEFIKEVVNKHRITFASDKSRVKSRSIFSLHSEDTLNSYFESLYSYFIKSKPPAESLLKLKFEELIINIISNDKNQQVINHFKNICERSRISLHEIMEANYTSNLTLDEFSDLCGRSLSTFKRDFAKTFGTSPGSWLIKKRLEHSRYLLETTEKNVYEIIFDCGFKNRSHFIRIFKDEYGTTPNKYKNSIKKGNSSPSSI